MGLLTDACTRGDKREMLEALRDITAETIENTTSGRDVAALSKRLIEICELIDALPNAEQEDPVEDLAAFMAEYDEYEDPRIKGYGD